MRTRLGIGAAIAMVATIALTGCSGTTGSEDAAVGTTPVGISVDGGAPVEGGAPAIAPDAMSEEKAVGTTATVPTDRQVVRTGYVSMRVEDVPKATFDVHALVAKRKGLVTTEDAQRNGDSSYANITAQIPAADLDAFVADVSKLGTVDSVSITAQDVTTQVVDLDARIAALETSIDRLTELLAAASRIEDLLSIETQLSQRQAELDSLKAQRTYLGDQVAMSTITVSLSPITEVAEVDAPGFWSGLQSGWAAFVSLVMIAITAVGFFLPFLIVLAVIAVLVAIVLVRTTRRNRQQVTPTTVPAGEEADADRAT